MSAATIALLLGLAVAPPAPPEPPTPAEAPAAPSAEAAACETQPTMRLAVMPGFAFWRDAPKGKTQLTIRYRVTPDGRTTDITVLPGPHHPMFEREVQRAVRGWTFAPFDCAPDGLIHQRELLFQSPSW
jgi:TonB family protein